MRTFLDELRVNSVLSGGVQRGQDSLRKLFLVLQEGHHVTHDLALGVKLQQHLHVNKDDKRNVSGWKVINDS